MSSNQLPTTDDLVRQIAKQVHDDLRYKIQAEIQKHADQIVEDAAKEIHAKLVSYLVSRADPFMLAPKVSLFINDKSIEVKP